MSPRALSRRLLVSAVLAILLTACGAAPPAPTTVADDVGSGAATDILDFSADTVSGDDFDGASLAGRPAVLWFWAPWCPTCRSQIAGVSALADDHGDDVGIVGVGSLDEVSAIEGFAADVPADFPQLLDPDGDVWRHFGVVEQSTYVVLDAEGDVVSEGYLDDAELAELVSDLTA